MTDIDTSALEVLLQELVGDLAPDVKGLLENPQLHQDILRFLHDVSSIESKDYLSSVPPTPGMDVSDERTLVQDIAELEAAQRSVDNKLKTVIVQSQQLIIDNKTELGKADELFTNDFTSNFKTLWRAFNEDDFEEMKEPQDLELQELEEDLEPGNKDRSFKSTVSSVKSLIKTEEDEQNKNLSTVLENMEQVINILELPSLTGACIKAGYYSEALEISSYTRRLAIRFPQSDLIKEVENGIRVEMSHMLIGLIRLLRTSLKQSSIIKIMSYLRRIQPFSQVSNPEQQLKRILLHARYQFIKFELDSLTPLKESELYEKYLKRSIEVIREHCFGSIMAYRNIFADIEEEEIGPVSIEIEEEAKSEEPVAEQTDEILKEDSKEEAGEGKETSGSIEKREEATDENAESTEPAEETAEPSVKDQTTESGTITEEKYDTTQITAETEKTEEPSEQTEEPVEEEETREDPVKVPPPPPFQFIKPASERSPSNLLLFDFVKHILTELSAVLITSLSHIQETSIRDSLYLQLIYCSQSLGRIDTNFSDLMTSVLLNCKVDEQFLVDRKAWAASVEKQKQLAKNLLTR